MHACIYIVLTCCRLHFLELILLLCQVREARHAYLRQPAARLPRRATPLRIRRRRHLLRLARQLLVDLAGACGAPSVGWGTERRERRGDGRQHGE